MHTVVDEVLWEGSCATITSVRMVTWEHDGETYCVLTSDVGTGEGRVTCYELSEARWVLASGPGDRSPVAGPAVVTVTVYAPEEDKPPVVRFDGPQEVSLAVLQHFMALIASELKPTGS
jgi:hypothetical protein